MAVAKNIVDDLIPNVVIIGAGITGLTAAYELTKASVQVLLLESSSQPGGAIKTVKNKYAVLEEGPESVVTHKPAAVELIKELGLGDQLVACSKKAARTFITSGGSLEPLPEGFIMFAPTKLAPLAVSPLFSLAGKFRIALDLVIPPRFDDEDESLADFVERRLGAEALSRLAEPLIAGIYSTDPQRLSARCAVPKLREMERRYGSVIRGLLCERRNGNREANFSPAPFLSLHGGMQVLTDELAARLPQGCLRLNTRATGISHGLRKRWRVACSDGRQIECDAIILATPAFVSARLLQEANPQASEELAAIEYGKSVMVSFVFERKAIGHALDGSGFVVPSADGKTVSACSFSSIKFSDRTDDDHVLLRAFTRKSIDVHDQRAVDELVDTLRSDIASFLNINRAPLHTHVTLPQAGLPRYVVGHQARVERIFDLVSREPGLQLAGNAYFGMGVPDCISSAIKASTATLDLIANEFCCAAAGR